LREIAKISENSAREFALRGQNLMSKINGSDKKTIAAINGFCFGGALDLVLACDERIASPNATFSHPGVSLGIITGWGGTQRLPRLVGETKALEMFLTAKRVDAAEALRIGLIDKISENPLAESLANNSTNSTSISL
jgi:enoyl-CoA hydratase/carnithine racemase